MTSNTTTFNHTELQDRIAVIGMSGRFPGAKNLHEFWQNLVQEKDTIYTFSDQELRESGIAEELLTNPHYIKRRGILTNIEYFDAEFFRMTPNQATMTDPQHRLFIEICLEALESAGYTDRKQALAAGVFAGMSDSTYLSNILLKNNDFLQRHDPFQTHIATSGHFLATKVSYYLNLKGPSISIQTACSTSLVAVIKACQSLVANECDIALAGGVSIRVPQVKGYLYQEGGILSQDGICRAFDKQSSGTVSSNGLGVVVLKRLQDAIRDENTIDAVIISHALNNDGVAKGGYAAPSVQGQSHCIATALRNIDPESIGYLETHGTGTALGDPIEIAALTKAFRQYTDKKNYCSIGSIKTNIGHTDTASGIAGFIKTVLALKHKTIPASLYFSQGNSYIDFESSPFYVQQKTTEWKTNFSTRKAGVSSFGIGGTNAHVILQEMSTSKTKTSKIDVPNVARHPNIKYWIEPTIDQNIQSNVRNAQYMYQPYWEVSCLQNKVAQPQNKKWLVFANNTVLAQEFIKQLVRTEQQVLCIYPGDRFQKTSIGYYLNLQDQNDYYKLFKSLSEENKNFDCIAHFWSIHENNNFMLANSLHTTYQESRLLSLIYFCKNFLKQQNPSLSILVVTNQAQQVLAEDEIIPDQSSLIAPCITIPQEYKNVFCKLVDIHLPNDSCVKSMAENLTRELNLSSTETIVAYRNGIRFERQYKDISALYSNDENFLKKNGKYLILGASGKVGLHVAYYLATHFSAQLILLSRKKKSDYFFKKSSEKKPLLADREICWETIQKNSSSFKIITADLSDEEQTAYAIQEIKSAFDDIDGIFHLAAATESSNIKTLIADMQPRQVFEQLTPKICGIKMMEKITKEIQTKFCCLFSSISSILGGIGLTSYIAGNIYLDSVAEMQKNNDALRWISVDLDAINIDKGEQFHLESQSKQDSSKLNIQYVMQLIGNILNKNIDIPRVIISAMPLDTKLNYGTNKNIHKKNWDPIEIIKDETTAIEKKVMNIFEICLGLKNVNTEKSFYELGGDSLDAIKVLELLESRLNVRLGLNDLTTYNSILKLTEFLKMKKLPVKIPYLVKLNEFDDNQPTLFLIHPIGGTTFCYSKLASLLAGKINCYGIQDPSLSMRSLQFENIEDIAKKYLNTILEIDPNANFFIGGFSFGASITFEMARRLKDNGKKVNPVIIIDGWAAFSDELTSYQKFYDGMQLNLNEVSRNISNGQIEEKYFIDLAWDRAKLLLQYRPPSTNIPILLFKAKELLPEYASVDEPTNYWKFYTNNIVKIYRINGSHNNILRSNCVRQIAKKIDKFIRSIIAIYQCKNKNHERD